MSGEPPLLPLLRDLILATGPIGLDRFMALALGHPVHGYYVTRDPLGAGGDFTTAPEISQMFGEMIGLWCAAVWQSLGAPAPLHLIELGPGRGTLMADLLRAAAVRPAFRAALEIHLVETSPVLRDRQAACLAASGFAPRWHDGPETLPEGPAIVLANEFFDALPVQHFILTERGWCERLIGLDPAGQLAFGLAAEPNLHLTLRAPLGATVEIGVAAQQVSGQIAARIAASGGAALFIDYGHARPALGETLQAVRRHAFTDVLAAPGEADLTAHVDFAALRRAAETAGAIAHGPVEQGTFLHRLGIAARAAQLARRNPDQAPAVVAALQRLTARDAAGTPGMGALFKALALTRPDGPPPPGFEEPG